jgi:hypothetical protein
MMTKDEVTALVVQLAEPSLIVDSNYVDECARALDGLCDLGVVAFDGSYDVDLSKLADYPSDVKEFIAGVLSTNVPTKSN